MESYSNNAQKSLGKLINELSVREYLALIDDLAINKSIKALKKKHRELIAKSEM